MRPASLLLSVVTVFLPFVPAHADVFPRDDIITEPTWQRFSVCYDNGCRSLAEVSFSEAQSQEVESTLHPAAASAAEEREQLRDAIALMEQLVGRATGTSADKGRTFNFSADGQMDCVDESTNTALYLTMFQRYKLLRHHRVVDRATRGWFVFGWPHVTAVIREIATSARWAVDSWFLDNGQPPYVLPLEIWKAGWEPED